MANTIVVGGTGTGASASDTNGGLYTGSVTYAQSQGTNGGPVDTASGGAGTNSGGFVLITSAGDFTNTLVGHWCYIDWAATYTDGWYEITARTDNTITLDLVYSADATATTVNVGGALATIDAIRANTLVGNGDTIKITSALSPYQAKNASGYILETGFTVTGGSANALYLNTVLVEGVDATTGEQDTDTKVELDGATNSATDVIKASSRHIYANFDVHGAVSDGIDGTGGLDYISVRDCILRDNGAFGITADDWCEVHNTEIDNNSGGGALLDNQATFCNVYCHDNAGNGLDADGEMTVLDCKVKGNTGTYQVKSNYLIMANTVLSHTSGILCDIDEQNSQKFIISHCTFDGVAAANGVVGVQNWAITTPPNYLNVTNCIFNELATGIASGATLGGREYINSNVFYNCTTDTDSNVIDGQNNITTDPAFSGADDYRLTASSPAKDTAKDWETAAGNASRHSIGAFLGGVIAIAGVALVTAKIKLGQFLGV